MKYIILLCLFFPVIAFSALPDYYPDSLDSGGVVNYLDQSKKTITINGRIFNYANTVAVHSLYSRNSFIGNVGKGSKIAYRWKRGKINNEYIIVEIWILPDDYIFEMGLQKENLSAYAMV